MKDLSEYDFTGRLSYRDGYEILAYIITLHAIANKKETHVSDNYIDYY